MQDQQPPRGFTSAQKTTLVESVIEQIIGQIREGAYPPGSRLPSERALMRMMSVGRSTVREALQALAAMNLVEIRLGRGGSRVKPMPPLAFGGVADGSVSDALERDMRLQLLEMRGVNERAVVAWAVQRATDGEIEELLACANVMSEHITNRRCVQCWESHTELHRMLAELSHNYLAARVVSLLLDTIPQSLLEKYPCEDLCEEVMAVHQSVADAVAHRDEQKALAAVDAHMEQSATQISP
jgi:GntR family transcriptional regulator, transcriptional repressor for pyruvate dehydrogenase complex